MPLFTGITGKISLPLPSPVYDTESINVVLSVVVILSGVAEANVAEPPLTDKESQLLIMKYHLHLLQRFH